MLTRYTPADFSASDLTVGPEGHYVCDKCGLPSHGGWGCERAAELEADPRPYEEIQAQKLKNGQDAYHAHREEYRTRHGHYPPEGEWVNPGGYHPGARLGNAAGTND